MARRRYAGVLVDIYYDHLLARDWAQYQPGTPSAAKTFTVCSPRGLTTVRTRARPLPLRMAEENWLQLRDPAGIANVLARMGGARGSPIRWPVARKNCWPTLTASATDFARTGCPMHAFVAQWRRRHLWPTELSERRHRSDEAPIPGAALAGRCDARQLALSRHLASLRIIRLLRLPPSETSPPRENCARMAPAHHPLRLKHADRHRRQPDQHSTGKRPCSTTRLRLSPAPPPASGRALPARWPRRAPI